MFFVTSKMIKFCKGIPFVYLKDGMTNLLKNCKNLIQDNANDLTKFYLR